VTSPAHAQEHAQQSVTWQCLEQIRHNIKFRDYPVVFNYGDKFPTCSEIVYEGVNCYQDTGLEDDYNLDDCLL
jgi:hypothetical protein